MYTQSQKSVILPLLLIGILGILLNVVFIPSIPKIAMEYGNSNAIQLKAKLIITLPALAITIFSLFIGYLIDLVGRKGILLVMLFLYAGFGVMGVFVEGLDGILVIRFLQGITVAGLMNLGNTISADYFDGERREKFFGLRAGVVAFSGIIFSVISGLVSDAYGWRMLFWGYLIGFLIIPIAWKTVRETKQETSSAINFKSLLQLKNKRYYSFILTITLIGMTLFFILPTQLPSFLSEAYSTTDTENGITIGVATVFTTIAAILYPKILKHTSYAFMQTLAFVLMGIGMISLGLTTSYTQALILITISGVGFGFMMPNSALWIFEYAPVLYRGTISGMLNLFAFLGQFLSPVWTQPIVKAVGYREMFISVGIGTALFAVVFWFVQKRIFR